MSQKNIIKRIISSPLVQTFLIYVSGGWIALEMTDYIINKYGLNEKISDVLPIILLIGLPVAILLAWYLSREKEESTVRSDDKNIEKKSWGIFRALWKKPWFSIPGAIVVVLLLISGIRFIHKQTRTKWANEKALPMIEQLRDEENYPAAFNVLQKAERYIIEDQEFRELKDNIVTYLTILTDPPGADVYVREYLDVEGEWEDWGKTPIDKIKLPAFTFYATRIERPGYENVLAVASSMHSSLNDTLYRKLFPDDGVPPGMVYVEGFLDEITGDFYKEKNGFFMDKYEVTNSQFKQFVDDGGYLDPAYWIHEFIKEGKILHRDEAMALLVDKSGRPGPAYWEASDYPDGQNDYPVSGISWYEAVAYAEYAGKNLPTADHWESAAGFPFAAVSAYFGSNINQISNFNGKGPESIGKMEGIGCFGTLDMAGNAREWCWNTTESGRIIRGGAWDDANYMYSYLSQLPAFNRSPKNGFRCVQYIDRAKIPPEAFQPIEAEERRDYYAEEPVSEEIFKIFKNQFLYDSMALDATLEERYENHDDWIIDKISFNAAYGNERVIAYLYLPKNVDPPFQTLIFFPGSYALYEENLLTSVYTTWFLDYLLKNGRAVLYPVYKKTFERQNNQQINGLHQYSELWVQRTKDFSRSVDYLETRPDIDTSKIGFYGHSLGGNPAMIIPAVEDRIKVSISIVGGLGRWRPPPEVDRINYLPRITTPVLMLNGKYDVTFPYETSVKPMYDLLGTPEKEKYLFVYDTDHYIPKSEMIKETLRFLDQYFGEVNN